MRHNMFTLLQRHLTCTISTRRHATIIRTRGTFNTTSFSTPRFIIAIVRVRLHTSVRLTHIKRFSQYNSQQLTITQRTRFNKLSRRQRHRRVHNSQRNVSTQVRGTRAAQLPSPNLTKVPLTRIFFPISLRTLRNTQDRPIPHDLSTQHMAQVPNRRTTSTLHYGPVSRHRHLARHNTQQLFCRRVFTNNRHLLSRHRSPLQEHTGNGHVGLQAFLRRLTRKLGVLCPNTQLSLHYSDRRLGHQINVSNKSILVLNGLTMARRARAGQVRQ